MGMTRADALSRILPEIERVRLLKHGTSYEKGGFMYPDCGYTPVDFKIIGFGWFARSSPYICAYGYHIAYKPRRYISRGIWPVEDVVINEGLNAALDSLIQCINRIGVQA